MKLRPKPYQNHVSPTKHKVIMHPNFHANIYNQTSNQVPYKDHTNSSISGHTVRYFMHIHTHHTLNKVFQPIRQPTTKNMEKNTNSCTSLTQARGPRSSNFRSSYRSLLRRVCQQRTLQCSRALAWARPPRLSETTLRPKVRSLARAITKQNTNSLSRVLTEASPSRLSEMTPRSK